MKVSKLEYIHYKLIQISSRNCLLDTINIHTKLKKPSSHINIIQDCAIRHEDYE